MSGKRILIVEDDPAILRGLEMNLQLEGYDVRTATDGEKALQAARTDPPDLILLDIMLPELNGYQVLQRLRRAGAEIPIIMVSAKSAELDVVMGLDLGADDYVTKPFGIHELLARIKVHLRRVSPEEIVRFGDVEVDLERRAVKRAGAPVETTRREFDLLKLLIEREGRALTRESVLNAVWGYNYFGTDRTVDNFITRLRQKLDSPSNPRHFVTVRGVGYRFVLEPE